VRELTLDGTDDSAHDQPNPPGLRALTLQSLDAEAPETSATLDAADFFTYGLDQIIASLTAARRRRRSTANAD
jgi:hypothetical protein